jgi:hypothetical protein
MLSIAGDESRFPIQPQLMASPKVGVRSIAARWPPIVLYDDPAAARLIDIKREDPTGHTLGKRPEPRPRRRTVEHVARPLNPTADCGRGWQNLAVRHPVAVPRRKPTCAPHDVKTASRTLSHGAQPCRSYSLSNAVWNWMNSARSTSRSPSRSASSHPLPGAMPGPVRQACRWA